MNYYYIFSKGLFSLIIQNQHLHIHTHTKRACFQTLISFFLTINDIFNTRFILHYFLRKCCMYLTVHLNAYLVHAIWRHGCTSQITFPDCALNLEMTTVSGSMGSASDNRLDLSCQNALSSCLWEAFFHLHQLLSWCQYHRNWFQMQRTEQSLQEAEVWVNSILSCN